MQTILITNRNLQIREQKAHEIIEGYIDIKKPTTDLYILSVEDGKAGISIDKVREMIKIAYLTPRNNDYCVVWIKDAQKLTLEAQNAMLKILEEPPSHLIFVLTADYHTNLIDTVRSRCYHIHVDSSQTDSNLQVDDSKADVTSILELQKYNIGEKIDWINRNIKNIERNDAIEILNLWELQLRDALVNYVMENNSNVKPLGDALENILNTKNIIQNNNANIVMAFEIFLFKLN